MDRKVNLSVGLLLLSTACSGESTGRRQVPSDRVPSGGEVVSREDGSGRPAHDSRPVILFVGTSLTAGLGVDPDSAYPALIQRKLDSTGIALHAVNAGVSGETSAGGG